MGNPWGYKILHCKIVITNSLILIGRWTTKACSAILFQTFSTRSSMFVKKNPEKKMDSSKNGSRKSIGYNGNSNQTARNRPNRNDECDFNLRSCFCDRDTMEDSMVRVDASEARIAVSKVLGWFLFQSWSIAGGRDISALTTFMSN